MNESTAWEPCYPACIASDSGHVMIFPARTPGTGIKRLGEVCRNWMPAKQMFDCWRAQYVGRSPQEPMRLQPGLFTLTGWDQ